MMLPLICMFILYTEVPSSKQPRPLSASRKSQKEDLDSTVEAKAVMEAMKKENERLKKKSRHAHSAPGRSQVTCLIHFQMALR